MEIFIDTAIISEIREAQSWGVVDGCTTNPKLIAMANVDFEKTMKEILELVKGPVSIEVTTNDTEEMIREGEYYNRWGANVVIKLPMSIEGLKAVKVFKEKGIKTNVTAVMSCKQAVLAAKAGATYVSLFWARIEDMGYDAEQIVRDTVQIFNEHHFDSKIILGSFRQNSQVNSALRTGAHVLTITFNLIKEMAWNPRTETTIQEFLKFWDEYKQKNPIKTISREEEPPMVEDPRLIELLKLLEEYRKRDARESKRAAR
jgi:transaldolase